MKRIQAVLFLFLFAASYLSAQSQFRIELQTSFPHPLSHNALRDYWMTTKYSAGISLPFARFSDAIASVSYTRQQPIEVHSTYGFLDGTSGNAFRYVPFVAESYNSEYGFFAGIRLRTEQNPLQAFVKCQLGMTATSIGTVKQIPVHYEELNPGGGQHFRRVEGTVVKFQPAALYGGGIIWNTLPSLSFSLELHAVDHMTHQTLDVYKSIGLHFSL